MPVPLYSTGKTFLQSNSSEEYVSALAMIRPGGPKHDLHGDHPLIPYIDKLQQHYMLYISPAVASLRNVI